MKITRLTRPLAAIALLTFALVACKKEIQIPPPDDASVVFPENDKDKKQVSVIKEVADILKSVYKNPKAYYEVNATIYSGHYADERVLLKDLLFPETSSLYKSEKFKSFKAPVGEFKKEFIDKLNKGNYPNLIEAFGPSTSEAYRMATIIPTDTAREIFSNSNGVSIYFPYSENFGSNFSTSYFDNINTDPFGDFATIVSADREADAAPGQEPYRKKSYDDNGDIVWSVEFNTVTVNDDYADLHPTHIVGVGAEPTKVMQDPPPPSTSINRVFLGWSRINNKRQYDRLISFTGNGGGSEIKVCRISGYLQFQNQQVTNFTGDQFEVSFRRREINNGTWKRVYGVWDPDWVVGNTEQIMAVYEEDTEGTGTFTGSLSTTVKVDTNTTATASVGFSVTVKTQDELLLQSKYSRASYFGAAKSDQGWGFQLCDTRKGSCRYDETFLPSGQYWPKYNEGANWNFTWPYNSY